MTKKNNGSFLKEPSNFLKMSDILHSPKSWNAVFARAVINAVLFHKRSVLCDSERPPVEPNVRRTVKQALYVVQIRTQIECLCKSATVSRRRPYNWRRCQQRAPQERFEHCKYWIRSVGQNKVFSRNDIGVLEQMCKRVSQSADT